MENALMTQAPYIPRLYGRRQDKALKPRQARLMESSLPTLCLPFNEGQPVDLKVAFPNATEYQLEIGFGGGEHLAWQARHHPTVGYIGAEPFINGVAKLLCQIEDKGLDNIRIHFGDARPLLEALPKASLTRLFVLHPDPWPKKRHYKRRMISPWFFQEASRILIPGGELRVTSDIPDYIRWTLMHARSASQFIWTAENMADWTQRPDDWPETRYAAKAEKEGRHPAYLTFKRKP